MIPSDPAAPQNLSHHHRILGVCWVLYGILCLVTAVWLVLFTNTATVMYGALLNRVPDPFSMMNVFHFAYALLVVISVACGIVGVLAGVALLSEGRTARTLALIAGFLSLSSVPLGTTLGIYTLIVLLPWAGRSSAAVAGVPMSHLKRQTSVTS
jgi:hypothetical protein